MDSEYNVARQVTTHDAPMVVDARLLSVINAWPELAEATRAMIVSFVLEMP